MTGGAVNEKSTSAGRPRVLALSHFERLQTVRFPVLADGVSRASSSGLRLPCLCLVTFGAVVSNTSRDFERLVSCSWLRLFHELVPALGLLYVLGIFSEKVFEGLSNRIFHLFVFEFIGDRDRLRKLLQ